MSNLPATINFGPTIEVPDNAPALKVDVSNPALSFDDVLPDNFISMEALERWLAERDAESRILTVFGVTMELLFDPGRGEKAQDGEWKPVLWFEETESGLVINKTRGRQLTDLAGSPLLARWAQVGQVAIKPGVFNGKAQVGVLKVPTVSVNGDGKSKEAQFTIDDLR